MGHILWKTKTIVAKIFQVSTIEWAKQDLWGLGADS
jgi:hypothetical protein